MDTSFPIDQSRPATCNSTNVITCYVVNYKCENLYFKKGMKTSLASF